MKKQKSSSYGRESTFLMNASRFAEKYLRKINDVLLSMKLFLAFLKKIYSFLNLLSETNGGLNFKIQYILVIKM